MSRIFVIMSICCVTALAAPVFAQSPEPTLTTEVSPAATLAPTTEPSPTITSPPLIFPNPHLTQPHSAWFRFQLRMQRLFASKQHKLELSKKISDAFLSQAANEQAEGKAAKAEQSLSHYEKEITRMQTSLDSLQATNDPTVKTFLDTYFTDQATTLQTYEAMSQHGMSNKLASLRRNTLEHLVKTLNNPNLTDAERQAKLAKVMDRYTTQLGKIDIVTQKLALKDELKDKAKDTAANLADDLDEAEDKTLDEASGELNEDQLKTLAVTLSDDQEHERHNLVVLTRLLDQVPDAAKPGIETALASLTEHVAEDVETESHSLEDVLNETNSDAVKDAVLKRLEAKVKKDDIKAKIKAAMSKAAQEAESQTQKAETKSGKSKANNSSQVKINSSGTGRNNISVSNSVTSSSSSSSHNSTSINIESSSGNNSTGKAETITVKIKEDGTFDQTNYQVDRGASLTIRFENNYNGQVALHLTGPGINTTSNSIGRNSTVTITSSPVNDTITLSTSVGGTTRTSKITVK